MKTGEFLEGESMAVSVCRGRWMRRMDGVKVEESDWVQLVILYSMEVAC